MSCFKCRTAANLLSGNYSSCKTTDPPSETRVLLTSREPENYSLTYSTFQCEMGCWKPVCRYISFGLDQNLSCFSMSLTQHAFWDRILSVFFSSLGIKIQNHPCSSSFSILGKNQGMNNIIVDAPVDKLSHWVEKRLVPFQRCLVIRTVWLPDLHSYLSQHDLNIFPLTLSLLACFTGIWLDLCWGNDCWRWRLLDCLSTVL